MKSECIYNNYLFCYIYFCGICSKKGYLMQNNINAKKVCIAYYLILMLLPVFKLFNGINTLDILYLVVLFISFIRFILFM